VFYRAVFTKLQSYISYISAGLRTRIIVVARLLRAVFSRAYNSLQQTACCRFSLEKPIHFLLISIVKADIIFRHA